MSWHSQSGAGEAKRGTSAACLRSGCENGKRVRIEKERAPRSGRFIWNNRAPGESTGLQRRGAGSCRPGPPDPALNREMQLRLFTTGWGATFAGRPTALWLPEARTSDADFGVRTNQFGFNIRWASDKVVVVEASPNLSNPVWTPVSTNTLTGGSSYFSDPQWTNHPTRFYRLRSP